jgi:predicted metal-dependent phosphoesterase TrpH
VTRADFHIHTEYSPDSVMPVRSLVRRCQSQGLGLIAVTDHNSIEGGLRAREMADFPVIIGEEVTTADGELTGLFLTEPIPRGLSATETARRIKDQGGLVSIPHPFDVFRRNVITPNALAEVVKLADIIEGFNARNTFKSTNAKAKELAASVGLPMTAVTDSHTAMEVGRTYTELTIDEVTPQALLSAIASAQLVERPITPLIHFLTTMAKVRKRLF